MRIAKLPNSYEVKSGETVFHRFTYQPLRLWDYVDQIRSGALYIFAPLLPLLTRSMGEALLIEERQLILTYEKTADRQRTLLTTAILIAAQSKLFNSDFLWELFKEDKMDFDNPVIAKLFDRAYGEKLAAEKQKLERLEQELQGELALATQRVAAAEAIAEAARHEAKVEAARREAEVEAAHREAEVEAARREAEAAKAETEMARQWQELMLKVLEHRFTSVPVALVLLLQAMKPAMRSRVTDIILEAPDVNACLQALRQLHAEV